MLLLEFVIDFTYVPKLDQPIDTTILSINAINNILVHYKPYLTR